MVKKYAVFDWDNTVRAGFTLFDWIDYLISHNIIDSSIQIKTSIYSSQYKNGNISHDEYAHLACREYAKAIKGISTASLKAVSDNYMCYDNKKIFDGMNDVFKILTDNKIDIIIISGAPRIVLDHYKKQFNIRAIKAFKERIINEHYTGQVAYNCGYNKQKTVSLLEEQYGGKPLFGFGDSNSDLPIMKAADHSFSINTHMKDAVKIDIINHAIDPSFLPILEQLATSKI